MTKLTNPDPLFLDGRGALLDAGFIYIGDVGIDPEVLANRLDTFWDIARTQPADQPFRTLGGYIVNGNNIASVYFAETDFSIAIKDANDNLVRFKPSAFDTTGTSYQPLDSDLSAIAALATTAYGRSALTVADPAALRALGALGSASTFDEATAAQYRANTADKVVTTDAAWGAAASVALAQVAGAVAVDLNSGINFTLAMTGTPWSLSSPTNVKDGQSGKIEITQDGTGSRLLTYGVGWTFAGATDPVLSTAPNAKDVLEYQGMSDGTVLGSLIKGRG